MPNFAVDIKTVGKRLMVSDVQDSVLFFKYKPHENVISNYADDTTPRSGACAPPSQLMRGRFCTACEILDYNTVAVGDKFGNISIVRSRLLWCCAHVRQIRLPADVADDVDEDPTGMRSLWDRGLMNGAAQKVCPILEIACAFAITAGVRAVARACRGGGDVDHQDGDEPGRCGVPCVHDAGGRHRRAGGPVLVVACSLWQVPFALKEDYTFMQTLEMHMRNEAPPLCGRDHLTFRSAYWPVKARSTMHASRQWPDCRPERGGRGPVRAVLLARGRQEEDDRAGARPHARHAPCTPHHSRADVPQRRWPRSWRTCAIALRSESHLPLHPHMPRRTKSKARRCEGHTRYDLHG